MAATGATLVSCSACFFAACLAKKPPPPLEMMFGPAEFAEVKFGFELVNKDVGLVAVLGT